MPGRYHTGSMATFTTETLPFGVHHRAVMGKSARCQSLAHLVQIEPGLRHGDAGADIDAFGDLRLEGLGHHMSPRIERDDAAGVGPLLERADRDGRLGIGEIGPANGIERAGGDSQRAVERVGAAVRADDVAVRGP